MMLVGACMLLAGCASTAVDKQPGKKVAYEERYVPTGTLFSNKDPKRTDRTRITNGGELEEMVRNGGGVINPGAKM
ncbi:hypothetical protein [Massilia sp. ST3]|uniref:hypothetical protein n=1 Tax=Massilia sp. ST3 TaxID=2824903 RepID=UPI001B827393|nr:hypothetical protein [Massilia sp. ST3]MBQ5946948.1 hypothetical protein [Massilia sp. ST3]